MELIYFNTYDVPSAKKHIARNRNFHRIESQIIGWIYAVDYLLPSEDKSRKILQYVWPLQPPWRLLWLPSRFLKVWPSWYSRPWHLYNSPETSLKLSKFDSKTSMLVIRENCHPVFFCCCYVRGGMDGAVGTNFRKMFWAIFQSWVVEKINKNMFQRSTEIKCLKQALDLLIYAIPHFLAFVLPRSPMPAGPSLLRSSP